MKHYYQSPASIRRQAAKPWVGQYDSVCAHRPDDMPPKTGDKQALARVMVDADIEIECLPGSTYTRILKPAHFE